jgi:hypothetical protein
MAKPGAGRAFFAGQMESAHSGEKMYLAGAAAAVTRFFHGRHGVRKAACRQPLENIRVASWGGLFFYCLAGGFFLFQRLDPLQERFAQRYPAFKHATRSAGNAILFEHEAFVIIIVVIFAGKTHGREPGSV